MKDLSIGVFPFDAPFIGVYETQVNGSHKYIGPLNYAWNAAVIQLREKVRSFGITIVPQIIDKDFDEKKLLDLRDSELLDLCLKLNLISETGYFMLSQCRDVRNNFSAAHPTIGKVDDDVTPSFPPAGIRAGPRCCA
ncbi:hypothetical protein [Croceicoccus naphthovorans]|uniref:hypothetical protein n=1 Tax=Croceicoccus naphthovorans TaxID=1348774 RepID=UPI0015D0BA61|nr:hypothetical protein [Croceicoccus naphthovorans]MBB3991609.1 hypothetical protein [Croceicoccus naphthovorans]